jgi:hypothetical protein
MQISQPAGQRTLLYRIYRRDEKGAIVKENDHLMDCCRYLVMNGLDRAIVQPVKGTRPLEAARCGPHTFEQHAVGDCRPDSARMADLCDKLWITRANLTGRVPSTATRDKASNRLIPDGFKPRTIATAHQSRSTVATSLDYCLRLAVFGARTKPAHAAARSESG